MFLMITLALNAAAISLCLLYIMNVMYTAKIMNRWNFKRTEEMIIGVSALSAFLMMFYFLIDTSL